VIPAVGLTWLAQLGSIAALGNIAPGLLAELLILLGVSIFVTGVAEGRPGLRRLFAGVLRWRVGAGWWAVALLALPVLTLLLALATGTYHAPDGGWLPLIGNFLFSAIVFGAILGNVWEELAWTGVVQRRLMERHGLAVGSLLTAIPFALIHLPMAFGGGFAVPLDELLIVWGVLIAVAPFMRYLMGMTYLGTGGSILVVGLLHASFNASGQLPAFTGFWQPIAALVVLIIPVFAYRALRLRRADEGELAILLPRRVTRAAV
jgi:membrane protease YdiL (CAAX protease family)